MLPLLTETEAKIHKDKEYIKYEILSISKFCWKPTPTTAHCAQNKMSATDKMKLK
jgi:hypothetical protein